jgi:hypothetical protein
MRCVELDEAIARASSVLCGTSWQSDLEWRAIGLSRDAGKEVVAFLDHWVNYRQRFTHNGVERLPDEIWTGDEHAARIARACFNRLPIRLVPNPYLEDLRIEVEALRRAAKVPGRRPVLLYLCEPIREHAMRQHGDERYWGYSEEEALEYFLDHARLIAPDVARIIVRRHPSEAAGKYSWAGGRGNVRVEFSESEDLVDDIAAADIVVGCESMGLVVAMLAGRRVISAIPPGGRRCSLPHSDVESLAALVELSQPQVPGATLAPAGKI